MSDYPEKLDEMIEFFESIIDREDRIDVLTSLADRFPGVPEKIATRPYPDSHRVEACESQVYVWAEEQPNKTLEFYFAVENPQGISAMATAVILDETLSGALPSQILNVPEDVPLKFFGGELSLRKQLGLANVVKRVKQLTRAYVGSRV
jgi:cysteine desulfuration protein SufE